MDKFIIDLIKNKIKSQRCTQQTLCHGICSKSTMSWYLNDKQEPDRLTFNALLQRLGASADNFTTLLSLEEYTYFEQKMRLLQAANQCGWNDVEKLLNSLYIVNSMNTTLQKQFLLIIRGILAEELTRNTEEAISYFTQAISLTCTDDSKPYSLESNPSFDLMSNLEWCAVLNLLCLLRSKHPNLVLTTLQSIIYQLEKFPLDEQEQIKIYPYAAYLLASCYFDEKRYATCENLCQKAISLLCKNWSLGNLIDLMEYDIRCKKIFMKTAEADKEQQQLDALHDTLQNSFIRHKWLLTPMMEHGQNIYIYGNLISQQRKKMNLSQQDLCNGICTLKTLRKIESGKAPSEKFIVQKLLHRLNVPISYFQSEIMTTDFRIFELHQKLKKLSRSHNEKEIDGYFNDFKQCLDQSILTNQQWICFFHTVIDYQNGILTNHTYRLHMESLLQQWFPNYSVCQISNYSLTSIEILLFLQLARGYEYEEDYHHGIEILEELLQYYKKQEVMPEFQYRNIAPIKINLIKYYIETGNYKLGSQLIASLIKEQVSCNSTLVMSDAIMGLAWIQMKLGHIPEAKKYYNRSALLSELFYLNLIANLCGE